jgi:hypothetical protein
MSLPGQSLNHQVDPSGRTTRRPCCSSKQRRGLTRQLQFGFKLPDPRPRLRKLTLAATDTGTFTEVDLVLGDPAVHPRFGDPQTPRRPPSAAGRPPDRHKVHYTAAELRRIRLWHEPLLRGNMPPTPSQTRSITRSPDHSQEDLESFTGEVRSCRVICWEVAFCRLQGAPTAADAFGRIAPNKCPLLRDQTSVQIRWTNERVRSARSSTSNAAMVSAGRPKGATRSTPNPAISAN